MQKGTAVAAAEGSVLLLTNCNRHCWCRRQLAWHLYVEQQLLVEYVLAACLLKSQPHSSAAVDVSAAGVLPHWLNAPALMHTSICWGDSRLLLLRVQGCWTLEHNNPNQRSSKLLPQCEAAEQQFQDNYEFIQID
jgi:hypothetical protein